MKYKGDSLVFTGLRGERTPFGSWGYSYDYEGTPAAVQAFLGAQPIGPQISTRQSGAIVAATLNYSPDTFSDNWEIDRENLEKDIMFSQAFAAITSNGKEEIRRWRSDPGTSLDTTKDTPHAALMNQAADLIRRGTEAIQVSTLVLKRTRSMSTTLAPTIVLTEQTAFYSTAKLVALTGMDPAIAATLPNPTSTNSWKGAYAPPTDAQWGWLPRQANRSYCAKGKMEEHSDWVFAAWSTVLYTYVSS